MLNGIELSSKRHPLSFLATRDFNVLLWTIGQSIGGRHYYPAELSAINIEPLYIGSKDIAEVMKTADKGRGPQGQPLAVSASDVALAFEYFGSNHLRRIKKALHGTPSDQAPTRALAISLL